MSTTTLPLKIVELNRAAANQALANTVTIAKVIGRNTMHVIVASRTAGKIVIGQTRSVVDRTLTTARNGAREVTGQVEAQGARVAEVVSHEANRTVDAALRAVDDKPSGRPFEQWTKAQLLERARELGVDGRNAMPKAQLIKALRN